MVDLNKIQATREGLEQMVPTPEAIKTSTLNTIHTAYDTIRGSGSVMNELGKVKDAYLDLPTGLVGNGLKACTQLLTFQPIKATCTLAKELTSACGDLAKIVASPVPIGLAAAQKTFETAKTVTKLPVTVPLKAYDVASNGVTKLFNMAGSAVPDIVSGGTEKEPPLPAKAA